MTKNAEQLLFQLLKKVPGSKVLLAEAFLDEFPCPGLGAT